MAKYLRHLDAHYIIRISSILHSIHVVLKNQEKIIFYINNYIDKDQFTQLYTSDWLKKR